jgi:sphinganine C4-monooxygenase
MVSNASTAASAMANQTLFDTALPPLPAYTLVQQTDFFSWISDFWLSLVAPVIVYWIISLFFHIIDVCDFFPQYRLHTPEEISSRNRVTRYEVFRDVIIQQVIQVITGAILALTDPPQMIGKEEYDVAVWATRVRLAQRAMPVVLGFLGLNATAISKNMSASHPFIAGALAGGYYPFLTSETSTPAFAAWEVTVAQLISNVVIPGLRFLVAIIFVDTWQYFLHRLMHMNKWMYSKLQTAIGILKWLPSGANFVPHSSLPLATPSSLCSVRLRGPVQPSV